jgi:hypothetical protein
MGLTGFYLLAECSLETDSFFLPLARLLAMIFLPLGVARRALNPCLFLRFFMDG